MVLKYKFFFCFFLAKDEYFYMCACLDLYFKGIQIDEFQVNHGTKEILSFVRLKWDN